MYIRKVEIKNLWGYDFVWSLHEDVNVLIGRNGFGKSTILQMIHEAILSKEDAKLNFRLFDPIDEIIIELEDDIIIRANSEGRSITGNQGTINYFINATLIDTFDVIEKSPNPSITLLDYQLEKLKQEFVVYQRDLSNQVEEALRTGDGISRSAELERISNIYDAKNVFLQILDELFSATGKKFDEKEFYFLKRDNDQHPILPERLSSGEKQILIILLTVLLQDKRKFVLFMDEPEISLHIDWQRKLISYIRQINTNAQIILATHSPTLYYQGWTEKAARIEDIQTLPVAGSTIITEKVRSQAENISATLFPDPLHSSSVNLFEFNRKMSSYTFFTKEECFKLLELARKIGIIPGTINSNVLISKVNNYTDAKEIFEQIINDTLYISTGSPKATIMLNTLMRKIDNIEQGIELMQSMSSDRNVPLYPNITTFSILIGKAKTMEEVKQIEKARNYFGVKTNDIYNNKLQSKR